MVVLGSVLVFLIIQSRRAEQRLLERPTEFVQSARTSVTRAIRPSDLEIRDSGFDYSRGTARHHVRIVNHGSVPYHNIVLHFTCLAADGKDLAASSSRVSGTIAPGQSLALNDLVTEVARKPAACRVEVLYSDLGVAESPAPDSTSE